MECMCTRMPQKFAYSIHLSSAVALLRNLNIKTTSTEFSKCF